MANDADPYSLFEDEVDENGDPVLSDNGKRFGNVVKAAFREEIADRMENMVETVSQYFEQEVTSYVEESVEDSVAELRKLMLLAVASIGGADKANDFIRKVAELARAGALSSATGAWAQGSPDDSANRDSVRGGGVSRAVRQEDLDDEKEEARAIFYEAAEGLTADETSRLMSLTEDLEFDGDEDKLRNDLKVIRESYFGSPATSSYVKAIARTIRR
jgi:hypothetical protein